jgi:N-methylhydantoinase B
VHWVSECEGREHAFVTGGADGFLVDHHAVAGGQISPRNQQWLIRAKTGQKEMVPAKRGPFFLEHGDQFIQLSRGGAGVGDPAERDPEKVRWDVLNELVSPERAQQVYKVVIAPDTFEIDQEATARLRASSQGGV